MIDKEVIIDEVNVRDCPAMNTYNIFGIEDKPCCYKYHDYCSAISDCSYKQLKRKERECEELKEDLHQNFKEKDKLNLIIDRLLEASGYDTNTVSDEDFEDVYKNMRYKKQQLDQLKVERDKIKAIGNNYFDEYEMCCLDLPDAIGSLLKRYDSVFAIFKKERKEFREECEKLKQTLAEIKEIAEVLAPMTDEYENCYDRDRCFECDFTEDCQYFNIKRIIQKISEVME